MTKRSTALKLYENWKELVQTHRRQGQLVLQVFGHPDGTLQNIAKAQESYKVTTALIAKRKDTVVKVLQDNGLHKEAAIINDKY